MTLPVTVKDIIKVLTLAAFVIALICAIVPTTVFADGWPIWTISGLLGLTVVETF